MHCPRCGVVLRPRMQAGIQVDVCDGCRGLWLDRGELEQLVAAINAVEWERASVRAASIPGAAQELPGSRKSSAWGRVKAFFEAGS